MLSSCLSRFSARVLISLFVLATPVLSSSTAAAQLDMTGEYRMDLQGPFSFFNLCTWSVTQVGSDIDIVQSCPPELGVEGTFAMAGTIDQGTGVITVVGTCGLGALSVTATGSPDEQTISGITSCGPLDFGVFATKCGNGLLDSAEDCEDSNRADGDCCSSSCSAEPSGQACDDPTPICTVSQCDGGGLCVSGNLSPSGTACDVDADACTLDECDGGGSCLPTGQSPTCDVCSVCIAEAGCVGDLRTLTSNPGPTECLAPHLSRATFQARSHHNSNKDRLKFDWGKGSAFDAVDLGDPTASTDYQVCMFHLERDGFWRNIALPSAVAGAGWAPFRGGFRYDGEPVGGLTRVVLEPSEEDNRSRVVLAGQGLGLGLPNQFLFFNHAESRIQIEVRADGGGCWGAGFSDIRGNRARRKIKANRGGS